MEIENFCSIYDSIVKQNANKLLNRGVSYDDLYQEGQLVLAELFRTDVLNKVTLSRRGGYISLKVKGALLDYIAKSAGTIAINHNKFYDKDFQNYVYVNDDVDRQIDEDALSQEDMIEYKHKQLFTEYLIDKIVPTLSSKELFVFLNVIMGEPPMTTSRVAEILGYKSKGSVIYLKKKVMEKFKKETE